jgi:hypothetical protein
LDAEAEFRQKGRDKKKKTKKKNDFGAPQKQTLFPTEATSQA